MPASRKQTASTDAIKAAYAAIVAYHNGLVQTRFTIAGLFLAANGLLAGGFSQASLSVLPKPALPTLAIILAIICWALEVRTYQLMENLGRRGSDLENHLGLQKVEGFFSLLAHQPIGPRLLPTQFRLPASKLFSHSLGLALLYILVALFWIIMLAVIFFSK